MRGAPPEAVGTPELEDGLVTASRRRHYAVLLDSGASLECLLKGRSTTLACGDRVRVARVAGGGSIEAVLPRATLFHRSDTFKEKLIAANVTQVVGVVAPDLGVDEELVNRWIIGAEAQGCRFVLAANKSDMPDFAALLARMKPFAALGYAVVPMSAKRDIAPLATLSPWAAHRPHRPVGDGQVDDPQRHRAARAGQDGGGLGSARHRPPHDVAVDALSAARKPGRRLGRRFARSQGFRPRPRRAGDDCGRVRGDTSAAGALPVSRLPARSRARLCRMAGGRGG